MTDWRVAEEDMYIRRKRARNQTVQTQPHTMHTEEEKSPTQGSIIATLPCMLGTYQGP